MHESEFLCQDCDKIFPFTTARFITGTETLLCPICGSPRVERLDDSIVTFLEPADHHGAEQHEP